MAHKRNPFEQLVKDLDSGKITFQHFQIAYRTHIRNSKVLPENIKNLLSISGGGGVIGDAFRLIAEIIGRVELAYRRGFSAGIEHQKQQALQGQKEEEVK